MAIVEQAGTKTIAELWRRSASRRDRLPRRGRRRLARGQLGRGRAVDEIANGLLSLGIGKGDAAGILGRTNLEWVLFDYALDRSA